MVLVCLLLIGITLTMLWKRLEQREPHFSLKIDEQCKEYLWSSVISRHDSLSFFELETARSDLAPVNRRRFTDPDTGTIGEEQNKVSYVVTASSEVLWDWTVILVGMLTSLDRDESQIFFSCSRVKFFEFEYPELTLGHTWCTWTTRSIWLPDRGWPYGHPLRERRWQLPLKSYVVGGVHGHCLLWHVVCLLQALLSCSLVHCLLCSHQWPSFTALQPHPV